MYLVMRESYDYECGWQEPIKAFVQRSDAKVFISEIETRFNLFKSEMEEIDKKQTEEQKTFISDDSSIAEWLPEKRKEYQEINKKWQKEELAVCEKYNLIGYNQYDEIEFTISEIELVIPPPYTENDFLKDLRKGKSVL